MKQKFYSISLFLSILFFSRLTSGQQFRLLKDINPGNKGSSYINSHSDFVFTNVGGTLFFISTDGIHGYELWKTDGTEAGTKMVKELIPGNNVSESRFNHLRNVNGKLYFEVDDGIHGRELWKSDGTEAGTVLIKDINLGPQSSNPQPMYETYIYNGLFYFTASDGNTGRELWKTDGTEAGTVLVKDIYPGVITSGLGAGNPNSGNPGQAIIFNGFLYFPASDGSRGRKLWKTDGTTEGTTIVKEIYPGDNISLDDFFDLNGVLYFTIYKNGFTELWKSDGSAAGTVLVKLQIADTRYSHPTALNGTLYFLSEGNLWKSDGTEAGTVLLKDKPYPASQQAIALLTKLNGVLYFTGTEPVHGYELWKSDGTVNGTGLVKDINPGFDRSHINALSVVGNKLMFSANDGVHGTELWISDGTEAGTKMVQDLEPGTASALTTFGFELSGQFIEVNGKVFADVKTSEFGNEIWVSDIPAESTLPLTLLEFKGSVVNNDGVLQWKTDNELNTASFIIERSFDGRNYKAIGSVSAANRAGVQYFDHTDPNIIALGASNISYRLKQTDIDGKYTYSNIVVLSVTSGKNFILLYPNPVNDKINMTINVSQKEKMQWQLTDNMGRIVKAGSYDLSPGSMAVSIDIANLSSGMYLIQLNSASLQKVIKVVKQ